MLDYTAEPHLSCDDRACITTVCDCKACALVGSDSAQSDIAYSSMG
jgi:hypothetical protein